MVTRKDIAERAQVSVSVVSRALNNSGYVDAKKREQILKIADELGYHPSPVAMSLMTQRTKQILFYCKDMRNAFNIEVYRGMPAAAEQQGYAFGIFWMRQYCQNNIPKALMEAARIDGCSEWTIFFRAIALILKPAYASLGIMQFVNQCNEFTQALIILRKEKMFTLPLLLRSMVSDRGTDYGAMMLASTCAVLPLLICFLCASKFFMDGLTAGAVKE